MPPFKILLAVTGLLLCAPLFAAGHKAAPPGPPPVPARIELSHHLGEVQAERVEALVEHFNSQHKDVHVALVRRVEGDAPKAINLVTRAEYARFVANQAKFKPLYEVMREAREPLAAPLAPELVIGLADAKGQLFALPVAFSTPVLFINKAAFRKAGLNPEAPPKTWVEMQAAAGKLYDSGNRCPFTTSWPAWVQIDNLTAWNGGEISDAKGNLVFNSLVQVKHVAMLATWHKSKYFIYFGRRDEADRRFANGECAMLTSSSSLFASLVEDKSLDVGVAMLPYHDDQQGAPQNTLADGASLWIANGLKPAETKGVAKFINYILGPEIQINLTLAGGFLPMTAVARTAAGSRLLGADLAALQVAYAQLGGKSFVPANRVSQDAALRSIVDEELESVWANRKPAKEALDHAVARGNAIVHAASPAPARKRAK
jgi:sn-glycerol 3-phosphate transport system substrate-binding protein